MTGEEDVGINYIGIEVPPYTVTAKTIAEHMGFEEGKVTKGLMVNQFRFPGHSDNFVTLAANNFLKFIDNAYEIPELRQKIEQYGIGAIYFATETSREGSKPGSNLMLEIVEPVLYDLHVKNKDDGKSVFVKNVLRSLKHADSLEMKFACTAEAKTLNLSVAAIRAGQIKSAIVIGSDIALYDNEKAKSAETTQGAASTLLFVTQDPLLIKMNRNVSHYNVPSNDFYKSNEHTPHVSSGVGSEINYVMNIGSALEHYEERSKLPDDFYVISHVPFAKEPIYLSSFLLMHWLRKNSPSALLGLENELGIKEPIGGEKSALALVRKSANKHKDANGDGGMAEHLAADADITALWSYHKQLREKNPKIYADFKERIGLEYSLKLPSQVGNSYNSSMWVATASLLTYAKKKKQIIFASYGSGSGTSVFSGEMLSEPGSELTRKLVDISSLQRGRELSVGEYRQLHKSLIEVEEHESKGNRMNMDKELLGEKSDMNGFKLIGYDEKTREGKYAYDGNRVKATSVIQ